MHAQTPSVTTHMFPLLSFLNLDLITEKAHPCFLLFKPDVSSCSLPLFSVRLHRQPLLFIVLRSEESIVHFKAVRRRVHLCVCV